MIKPLVLGAAASLAFLRLTGEKGIAFQAVAHGFVFTVFTVFFVSLYNSKYVFVQYSDGLKYNMDTDDFGIIQTIVDNPPKWFYLVVAVLISFVEIYQFFADGGFGPHV